MSKKNISGRKDELLILERVLLSPEPEFMVIYGRRRVGKTWLIREFFGEMICFELTGMHKASLEEQLTNFAQSLAKATGITVELKRPSSWSEAFSQLERFLESSFQRKNGKKQVLFLDELPWLNTPRSKFLSALEHFWNSFGSRQRNLILLEAFQHFIDRFIIIYLHTNQCKFTPF